MSTFVLIHGAWHGGWAWKKVVPLLEKAGHTVITPDLPGHGQDRLPVPDVTMDRYVESVIKLVEAQSGKVVLSGHSMSGAVISQVAERVPEKIERLVYVCAFLLPNRGSVLGAMQEDADGQFLGRLGFNVAGNAALFDKKTLSEVFYNKTPEHTAEWAIPYLLDVQPTQPLGTQIAVSEEKWGGVPRVYVKCMEDRILSPSAQQKMIEARPCQRIVELAADHAPFLSAPVELAEALMRG